MDQTCANWASTKGMMFAFCKLQILAYKIYQRDFKVSSPELVGASYIAKCCVIHRKHKCVVDHRNLELYSTTVAEKGTESWREGACTILLIF